MHEIATRHKTTLLSLHECKDDTHQQEVSSLQSITNFPSSKNTRILAQTPTQDCRTGSSLSFNRNHFAVFGGRPAHWLPTWKLMLPLLNELRRLPQILGLVTLEVRHAARQGVRGFGCGWHAPTQRANTVVDVTFGSCSFATRRVRAPVLL